MGLSARGGLFYMTGVQAFARRQTDDLLIGYEGPGFSTPILDEDGRRIDAIGLGLLYRVEVRTVGPVYLGVASAPLGVSWERTRGAVVEDGTPIRLGEGETRDRVRFGGPSRLYLGVRL